MLYDRLLDHGSAETPAFPARDHKVNKFYLQMLFVRLVSCELIFPSYFNPMYWWPKLELDSRTVLMMLKGALAPTITIAMYVSHTSRYFGIQMIINFDPDIRAVLSQISQQL